MRWKLEKGVKDEKVTEHKKGREDEHEDEEERIV
jgi:hypothetical protein